MSGKQDNIDILYLVSHGFAARMVMQTNLLGQLALKGLKIGLVSLDEYDDNLQKYAQKHGISLFRYPKIQAWTSYLEYRKYIWEDLDANICLKEKYLYATKYSTARNPFRPLFHYGFYGFYKLRRQFPFLQSIFRKYEEVFLSSESVETFLRNVRPKLVVSTYPVNINEAAILYNAKKSNIKSCIHLLSWDNITCKGRFPQTADYYIAWGNIMRDEFQEYYKVDLDKIFVCGVPHFDLHLKSKEAAKGRPKDKYLFFAMSAPRFTPHEIDIVTYLANKIEENEFGSDVKLVIRPHPQNVHGGMEDKSWLVRLGKLVSDRVRVDYPKLSESRLPWSMQHEDLEQMSRLLAGASICLNSGSTVSIDALMCGVPVILTSFDGDVSLPYWKSAKRLIDYPHLKKFVGLGGVEVVDNYQHLSATIKRYLVDPNVNIDKRQYALEQECYVSKETATNLTVNTLYHLDKLK